MNSSYLFVLSIYFLFFSFNFISANYKPDWSSIDSRPVPSWYDDAKFGIFSHWGVYSVPAFGSEWFWYRWKGDKEPAFQRFVEKHYPNGTTYADFAKMFTAEDFDAHQFAEVIKASGAKYFVLTSKHHEGFTLWPSSTSWNWNSVDIGPHRDLVNEMSVGIRSKGIHFGLYFSMFDWFHPLYLKDKTTKGFSYPKTVSVPQLWEIVNNYHPEVIWSDGDWEQTDEYWHSKEFLAWLYNESPVKDVVAVNDRWGRNMIGKHGGFMTYSDHYDPGHLQPRKWENCITLDKKSWGFRRDMTSSDVHTLNELITQLARTISCGGNFLLNVGPTNRGQIVPIFEERLRQLGQWIGINQEAIYGSKPWIHQSDGDYIWYTSKVLNDTDMDPHRIYNHQQMHNTVIYAFILRIPRLGRFQLNSVKITDKTRVSILGTSIKVPYKKTSPSLWVDLSPIPWQDLPNVEAIVLKIEYAASSEAQPFIDLVNINNNTTRRERINTSNHRSSLSSSSSSSSDESENSDERDTNLVFKNKILMDDDGTEF